MKTVTHERTMRLLDRALIGTLFLLALILLGVEMARAGEIVPSVGWSHATDEGAGQGTTFGALALRNSLVPMLKYELGVAYRSEKLDDAGTKIRQTPVTASLWLSPVPTLYAGAGIGWYNTTIQHPAGSGLADETTQKMGTHVGGGFLIPIVPSVASLDFGGRYVFLDRTTLALPTNTKADFWSVSAGVAIKLF